MRRLGLIVTILVAAVDILYLAVVRGQGVRSVDLGDPRRAIDAPRRVRPRSGPAAGGGDKRRNGAAVPFHTSHDWVAEIRGFAESAIVERLRLQLAPGLVQLLPLVGRLGTRKCFHLGPRPQPPQFMGRSTQLLPSKVGPKRIDVQDLEFAKALSTLRVRPKKAHVMCVVCV